MSAVFDATTGASAQKVFICYRREETAAHAGRLYDAMVSRFGEGNVFMDVDMAPGVDFIEQITDVVSGCLALIVVIGPTWATIEDEAGNRRIEDPDDFVRLEVKTGLGGSNVTPIPVLVSGARMPRPESLPEELRPITRRNALELSEARWGYDVGRLFDTLGELLPGGIGYGVAAPPQPRPPLGKLVVLEGMLVAGATAAAARLLGEGIPVPEDERGLRAGDLDGHTQAETIRQIAGTIAQQTEVLALVGLALAVWLAVRIRRIDPWRPGVRGLLVGAIAGAVSGAIWALPVFLPDDKVDFHERAQITLGAIAVGGGLLGALIGSLWPTRRVGAGFACGAAGGALFQLVAVLAGGWRNNSPRSDVILSFGLAAAAIAGLTLAAMLVLDRRQSRARAA
jgi:hypothetical protein